MKLPQDYRWFTRNNEPGGYCSDCDIEALEDEVTWDGMEVTDKTHWLETWASYQQHKKPIQE